MMIAKFKRFFYFPVASYFRFFASIRLKNWNPKIIVVTGSNGKTTLLHLLESQIGDKARYSHKANSSFGIPFDILDLHRTSLLKTEWLGLFLKAPFQVFKKIPKEKIYIVEADCDRPEEGRFLGEFLKPSIVLWLSSAKTHSMNFEKLVSLNRHPERSEESQRDSSPAAQNDKFNTVEEAIAYEFGFFVKHAKDLVIANGDSELIDDQLKRTHAKIIKIKVNKNLQKYKVGEEGTTFEIEKEKYKFKYLLPAETVYAIKACKALIEYLGLAFDKSFSKFVIPPGRGSIFQGIKDTVIIDSSYNLSPGSISAILETFNKFSANKKLVVMGDMLELGESEREEHEKLAENLSKYDFDKIILTGPRVGKFTYPKLDKKNVEKFLGPKETLDYIITNLKGGETILFKGARFMEGIIEHLLADKEDIKKLARRERIWEIRRSQWGL